MRGTMTKDQNSDKEDTIISSLSACKMTLESVWEDTWKTVRRQWRSEEACRTLVLLFRKFPLRLIPDVHVKAFCSEKYLCKMSAWVQVRLHALPYTLLDRELESKIVTTTDLYDFQERIRNAKKLRKIMKDKIIGLTYLKGLAKHDTPWGGFSWYIILFFWETNHVCPISSHQLNEGLSYHL